MVADFLQICQQAVSLQLEIDIAFHEPGFAECHSGMILCYQNKYKMDARKQRPGVNAEVINNVVSVVLMPKFIGKHDDGQAMAQGMYVALFL